MRWFIFTVLLAILGLPGPRFCLAASTADDSKPISRVARKILLIAGAKDPAHPKGTHEYEKSIRLVAYCLEHAENIEPVDVETCYDGWPKLEQSLETADTIVIISSGSDRKKSDHPLLVGDRMQKLDRQMKRGCGLVLMHWTTFFPNDESGEKALQWIGGHFDYQSGPPPQHWASAIQTLTTTAEPASPSHPICRGLNSSSMHDEFYYRLKLQIKETGFHSILKVRIPGEKDLQTVAWGKERKDGGRGFGFTGGHFLDNWWQPNFRMLVLNAILWTAHATVPDNGVRCEPPNKEWLETPLALLDWTPRPVENAEPWQLAIEKDWVDGRFRSTETGPFLNATMSGMSQPSLAFVRKGTAIRLLAPTSDGVAPDIFVKRNENHSKAAKATALTDRPKNQLQPVVGGVIFDRGNLRVGSVWTDGFLQHKDTRFSLLNTPTPVGRFLATTMEGSGWSQADGKWPTVPAGGMSLSPSVGRFERLIRSNNDVTVEYSLGKAIVREQFLLKGIGQSNCVQRQITFVTPPGEPFHRKLYLADVPLSLRTGVRIENERVTLPKEGAFQTSFHIKAKGDVKSRFEVTANGRVEADITAKSSTFALAILYSRSSEGDNTLLTSWQSQPIQVSARPIAAAMVPSASSEAVRKARTLVTKGTIGKANGAFAIDTLTLPFQNPYRALMFVTALDFLPNGDIAVATAHGDVWIVREVGENLQRLEWTRFASGLYQPMGLKVVDGEIVILERGQLTRLRDLDQDGQADVFENLCNNWDTGIGEHSYDTCLETDPQGNYYFFKTGEPQLPMGGCLLKVSKDCRRTEVFATGFRHPIGMGMSPSGFLTGADQQGNWIPATPIDAYAKGGFYGFFWAHHRKQPPETFDPPICWLPHTVDNSAAGQVWIPAGKFGSLSGLPIHLSYGRCKAMVLLMEQTGNGLWQGGCVDLPGWEFASGSKTGRFHPIDGSLYVVGTSGWQTSAKQDGCLQRVRYVGGDSLVPTKLHVDSHVIQLTFGVELNEKAAKSLPNYRIDQWNYLWSKTYGSSDYLVSDSKKVGHDRVAVDGVELSADRKTVSLKFHDLKPAMQIETSFRIAAADGRPVTGILYHTLHPGRAETRK